MVYGCVYRDQITRNKKLSEKKSSAIFKYHHSDNLASNCLKITRNNPLKTRLEIESNEFKNFLTATQTIMKTQPSLSEKKWVSPIAIPNPKKHHKKTLFTKIALVCLFSLLACGLLISCKAKASKAVTLKPLNIPDGGQKTKVLSGVTLVMSFDKTTVAIGEKIQTKFSISDTSKRGGEIKMSVLNVQSDGAKFINKKSESVADTQKETTVFTYTFQATKAGRHSLGPWEIMLQKDGTKRRLTIGKEAIFVKSDSPVETTRFFLASLYESLFVEGIVKNIIRIYLKGKAFIISLM